MIQHVLPGGTSRRIDQDIDLSERADDAVRRAAGPAARESTDETTNPAEAAATSASRPGLSSANISLESQDRTEPAETCPASTSQ